MTNVRRERIVLHWSTVRERMRWPKVFVLIWGIRRSVSRRTKLPGRGVHSEKVREIGRR